MKKYIFILTYWLGGGTEKVFENIAKAFHGPETQVILYVINGFDVEKYSIEDYVTVIKTRKELFRTVTPDTIVVNFSGDWKSSLTAYCLSKNYVSWIHCNPYTMKGARTGFFNFWLLKKSKKIVCVCNEQKEILQNEFKFRNDFSVIYNSVDFDTVRNKATENLDFDSKYFLMIARMDFNSKDFFTVIDAYSMLDMEIQNEYKLVFLGDGNDRSQVEEYIKKKNLTENVVLPGFDKNPYKWFKNAVCNILSSKTEGFGVSIIEGMSIGCPEIITNYRTGAKEISANGSNAIIVDIGDAEAMKNAMKTLVYDNERRENLIKNANSFIQNFSQNIFEKRIIDFFGDL